MLSIYICEDDLLQLQDLKKLIQNEILINELDMKLAIATTDPASLLKKLAKKPTTSLYFLDMDLSSEETGISLALKIRELDPLGFIVYVTSHENYMLDTFHAKVGVLDYILKHMPNKKERVLACLHTALERYHVPSIALHPVLPISLGKSKVSIPFSDISYITTAETPHRVIIYTKYGFHDAKGSLSELEPKLNADFLRCHKNSIVNMRSITKIDTSKRRLTFANDYTCEFSVRCKTFLIQKLTEFGFF